MMCLAGGKFQVAFLDKIGYLKAYSTFRAAFYRIFARLPYVAARCFSCEGASLRFNCVEAALLGSLFFGLSHKSGCLRYTCARFIYR